MIKDLAINAFRRGEDLPLVGVYVTDFGAIELIPITEEEVAEIDVMRKLMRSSTNKEDSDA
jgi:hypothetical protein